MDEDRQYGWIDEYGNIHHNLEKVILVNFESTKDEVAARIAAAYQQKASRAPSEDLLKRAQAARERAAQMNEED